jgi:chromosome segregation ATPase
MQDNPSQEAASEPSREDAREGEWLSYAELSRIRGIGRESAKKLALREGWRRIPGNDGSTRVLVPREWLKPARELSRERTRELSREDSRVTNPLKDAFATALAAKDAEIAALRAVIDAKDGELAALRGQIDGFAPRLVVLETERDRLVTDLKAALLARSEAEALRGQLEAERDRVEQAETATEQAHAQAREARGEAEKLRQQIDARKARGRWARLRAAWRGE